MLTFELQSQIHISQSSAFFLNILPPYIKQKKSNNAVSDLLL